MSARLLIITDTLVAGGIERDLVLLAPQLKDVGYDICILCLYGQKSGKELYFLPDLRAVGLDVRVLDLALSPMGKLKGILAIIRHAWLFRAEMVLTLNYHANLLSRLGRFLFPFHTRLVGTVHSRYSQRQLRYERLSWWLCQKIVCNGIHLKHILMAAGVPANHVAVIANGIDLSRFNIALQNNLREQLNSGDKRIFLSIGRITREKMFHHTVEAIGRLKAQDPSISNFEYWIVGSADESDMLAAIHKTIEDYNLQSVVRVFPVTNNPLLFYSACDATILYSPSEGLPNVVLESLAAGKPAIVSTGANGAQLITDGQDGWVVPNDDIGALSETIRQVLEMPMEELARMRNACIRRAQDFSLDHTVHQYDALFSALQT